MSYIFGNLPFSLPYDKNGDKNLQLDISSVNYKYKYPNNLDFKPGSEFHTAILEALKQRISVSSSCMSSRYESWRNVDRKLTTYIDLTQGEVDVKSDDERKPVSMVVPISYANRDVMVTYLMAALLDHPFSYEPTSPEDIISALLMEHIVNHQVKRAKTILRILAMWYDGLTYGIAPTMVSWKKKYGYRTFKPTTTIEEMTPGSQIEPERRWILKDEYNEVFNFDPYNWLPDTMVTPDRIQEGEYHSMVYRTNLMSLLSEEQYNKDDLFNVKYLKHLSNLKSIYNKSSESGRYDKSNFYSDDTSNVANPVDIIPIMIQLIPRDWHLGDGEYPEKWIFKIAGDQVIISAKPMGSDEDEFPLTVDAPTFDGHSISPTAMLELGYGMQEVVDWMFNSHIANVRKAINDMLIVDPYMLNMDDVMNPGPGKLIRLNKRVWGKGVKDAIYQLAITDITRNNVADITLAMQLQDLTLGTTDPVKGTRRRSGDRVTATEISSDRLASLSRFEKLARVSHIQSFTDLARIMANNTRQYMTQDIFINVVGRYAEDLFREYGVTPPPVDRGFMKISPQMLQGSMDVKPSDGSMPGATDTQAWLQIMQLLGTQPYLLQKFDIFRIFSHLARGLGVKNVRDFEVKVQPNQSQLEGQVQQGNAVPAMEYLNSVTNNLG